MQRILPQSYNRAWEQAYVWCTLVSPAPQLPMQRILQLTLETRSRFMLQILKYWKPETMGLIWFQSTSMVVPTANPFLCSSNLVTKVGDWLVSPTAVSLDSVWVAPQSHSMVLRRSDQYRPAVTVDSTGLHWEMVTQAWSWLENMRVDSQAEKGRRALESSGL